MFSLTRPQSQHSVGRLQVGRRPYFYEWTPLRQCDLLCGVTNAQLAEKVLAAAQKNRIWVNAFALVRPTDETLRMIGKAVVEMLQTKENLLPHFYGTEYDGKEPVSELQTLTPVLYMSINAS